MTRKELEDYIKSRTYYCEFCGGLRREVMERGLIAIKEYRGMICGGVMDMQHRLYEVEDWEKEVKKMTLEEKQLVMSIARDIYVENLRKGKNVPATDSKFVTVVKGVKEGLESLDTAKE